MKVKLVEDNKVLTFKQLVKLFASVNTKEDLYRAEGQIDNSFQHEKISWDDHELLYDLSAKIDKGI